MEFNFKSNSAYSYMKYGDIKENIKEKNTIWFQIQRLE